VRAPVTIVGSRAAGVKPFNRPAARRRGRPGLAAADWRGPCRRGRRPGARRPAPG